MKSKKNKKNNFLISIKKNVLSKDPDYKTSYVYPEILKKLNNEFKDEFPNNDLLPNKYGDKILSIVRKAIKVN